MTERPILFSAPMVRALLAGTKSQTRRLVKVQRGGRADPLPPSMVRATIDEWRAGKANSRMPDPPPWWGLFRDPARTGEVDGRGVPDSGCFGIICPYGKAGDRLWVRETWSPREHPELTRYRATDTLGMLGDGRWHPSIHMPRALSRITLEVTQVRVQRLQDINGEDARAEGIACPRCGCEVCARSSAMCPADADAHALEFGVLWDSINGEGSWKSNPWVWAVSFRKLP